MAQAVNTAITYKHVSDALDGAGHFDVYVLRNVKTGEIDTDHMPSGIAPNYRDEWQELVMVPGWQISKIARMKVNGKRCMREALENY